MARKASSEPDFDRELADLPPELRWREWKARVEAVMFAAPKPVTREVLARVVGRDCVLDLLLDDLREELARPAVRARQGRGGFALHTRAAFGPAVRVASTSRPTQAAHRARGRRADGGRYFQPVTRGEISEMFGREISRDLIAALREEDSSPPVPAARNPGRPTPM